MPSRFFNYALLHVDLSGGHSLDQHSIEAIDIFNWHGRYAQPEEMIESFLSISDEYRPKFLVYHSFPLYDDSKNLGINGRKIVSDLASRCKNPNTML